MLLSLLPQTAAPVGVGSEWLTIAAIVIPFLLLIAIMIAGRKRV